MKKLFQIMAVILAMAAFSFDAMAVQKAVPLTITTAAIGATNTILNVNVDEWQTLEGLQVTWPAASTNTLTLYCVAANGVTQWAITDAMTYVNATAAAVTVSYNPTREFSFSTTNTGTQITPGATNATNNVTTVVANLVTKPYVVNGTFKYVLTRTGTASQTIYPVLFLKKD